MADTKRPVFGICGHGDVWRFCYLNASLFLFTYFDFIAKSCMCAFGVKIV